MPKTNKWKGFSIDMAQYLNKRKFTIPIPLDIMESFHLLILFGYSNVKNDVYCSD
jgi:hypothetical protein